MVSLTEISAMLRVFSEARKSLEENNTPEILAGLLIREAIELQESLEDPKNLAQEIADVIIFAMSIANIYGFDMGEEILTKIAYNTARYQASDFEGDYESARLRGKAREEWVKPMFYE